jgi:structural maintenance of chromosomes protein 5
MRLTKVSVCPILGMDAVNERKVHSLMIDQSIREKRNQSFIISPKLLPDLEYHDNVTIHSIYFGELEI